MFLPLCTVILVLTGPGQSLYPLVLTCPHEVGQRGLRRVWCKQSSVQCCSGFSFQEGTRSLGNGDVQVQQAEDSFTVTAWGPAQGEGVYWCGLLDSSNNNTIIKLAELQYSHQSSTMCAWSIIRWILMAVLPLMVIFTHIYSYKAHKLEESLKDNI